MARSKLSDLLKIFKSSVYAVLPENVVRASVKYSPANEQLSIAGDNYYLHNKNVYLVGAGKAVQNMAKEFETILGDKIKCGIISIPFGSSTNKITVNNNISYYEGAVNNLPDPEAAMTATKIRDLVDKLGCDDLLLVLISGGGSALLPLPKPPITLDEKTTLIKCLSNSGADIKELNTVRKRLSDLKGGKLSMKAQPAQVISLILSDIVGDPLDLIASGPTIENEDDPSKAIDVINKYYSFNKLPDSIKSILNKVDSFSPFPKENVKNYVIGSNKLSLGAALEEAKRLNYFALSLSEMVTGKVKIVANVYLEITKLFCSFLKGSLSLENLKLQLKSYSILSINKNVLENLGKISLKNKDLCLIFGGEVTVEVKGSGKGGRNQELALQFSSLLGEVKHEINDFDVWFLSAGTDGIDGPTDAAGAVGYLDLVTESKEQNLNIQKYLDANDSYNFYKTFKQGALHIITGHTNTNVMDIHLIIISGK